MAGLAIGCVWARIHAVDWAACDILIRRDGRLEMRPCRHEGCNPMHERNPMHADQCDKMRQQIGPWHFTKLHISGDRRTRQRGPDDSRAACVSLSRLERGLLTSRMYPTQARLVASQREHTT
jgi:hypothetical protein